MIEQLQQEMRIRRSSPPAATTRRTPVVHPVPRPRRRHALAQGLRRVADALDT